MKIPDSIEPVVGYRAWRLTTKGELQATWGTNPWTPGKNEAICHAAFSFIRRNTEDGITIEIDPTPHGRIPDPDCQCGFWVLNDLKTALTYFNVIEEPRSEGGWIRTRMMPGPGIKNGYVFGRVKGYGRVVEAENGWRAQYAEIEAFYDSTSLKEEFVRPTKTLAKKFGVEIEPMPARFESLAPEPKMESLSSSYDYGYLSSGKPRTAEQFEKMYAHNSGMTVEQMRELFKGKREVRCCHCKDPICLGWQMAYIEDDAQ